MSNKHPERCLDMHWESRYSPDARQASGWILGCSVTIWTDIWQVSRWVSGQWQASECFWRGLRVRHCPDIRHTCMGVWTCHEYPDVWWASWQVFICPTCVQPLSRQVFVLVSWWHSRCCSEVGKASRCPVSIVVGVQMYADTLGTSGKHADRCLDICRHWQSSSWKSWHLQSVWMGVHTSIQVSKQSSHVRQTSGWASNKCPTGCLYIWQVSRWIVFIYSVWSQNFIPMKVATATVIRTYVWYKVTSW